MDFAYPPEAEAFRAEVRAWLAANLSRRPGRPRAGRRRRSSPSELDRMRAWNRTLADAGYAAIAWPVEYGGRGAGVMEQVVFAEEMSPARTRRAPSTRSASATSPPPSCSGAPTEQKRRFLPRMLRGDDIWCQGFSEPDAGSDLASLRTRAVLDGDTFVVNGQKVWNTLGHLANWCELLVRTDPDVAQAQGHLLPARRHDPAGCGGAPAGDDHRRAGVQRDLLRRRAGAARRAARDR